MSGWFIIFQNLFYIPIIIACINYTKKGFVFSVFLTFIYFFLIISFTKDSVVIIQALIRILIFVGVAGVTTFLSIKLRQTKELLHKTEEHICMEEALRKSEQKFRALFESAKDGILQFTADGTIIEINKSFASMHGYTVDELMKKNFEDLDTPKSRPFIPERMQRLLAGESMTIEVEHFCKDGQTIPLEVSASLVTIGDQKYILGFHRDITERKQAEKTLKENEIRFKTVADFAYDWEYWEGMDSEIIYMSPSCERISGYKSEEFLSDSLLLKKIIHPDYTELLNNHLKKVHSIEHQHEIDELDFKIIKKDGTIAYVGHICRPVFDNRGNYYGRRVSNRDITERKKAEEELAFLNLQKELILNSVAEGILGLDLQGHHTFVNPIAARTLGYEPEELIGLHSHSIWHHTKADGSPYPQEECRVLAAFRDGKVHRASNEVFWKKDGTSFYVEYASSPIYERGSLAGAVVTFTDITERKQAEEALWESERRYRNLFDQANEGLLIMTPEGRLSETNRAFAEMHGYNLDEFNSLDIRELDILKGNTMEDRADIARRIHAGEVVRFEVEHYHKDGHIFPLSVTASLINIDGKQYFLAFHQDITERKQTEEKLHESENRMNKEIKRSLVQGQENERKRIAREIHDGLCQILSVADMSLTEMKIKSIIEMNDIYKVSDFLKTSLNEAIRISNNLSPAVLVDFGLIAGLKKLIKLNSETTKDIILRTNQYSERLPSDVELTFYRIAQEALRNAITHAECSKIYIIIYYTSTVITMKIIDNGKGIDETALKIRSGFGLNNIFERAKLIGANVRINSKKNKFTSVYITL